MKFKKSILSICAFLMLPLANIIAEEPKVNQSELVSLNSSYDLEIDRQLDEFVGLMQKRLDLMGEAAKWKWNNTVPIDNQQEDEVFLQQITSLANEKGLNTPQVKEIFKSQLNAGKIVQINAFEKWVETDVDLINQAPDYQSEIKPKLDQLDRKMVNSLSVIISKLDQKGVLEQIRAKGLTALVGDQIDDAVRETALEPFIIMQNQHLAEKTQ
jgi:chorismate mutase